VTPRLSAPALAALALVASACSTADLTEAHAAAATVTIQPPSAQLPPGGQVGFQAAVTGAADTAVTWSVQEANGGSVSAGGTYTAPATNGTFHVVARAAADPTLSAQAVVTVTSAPPPPPPPPGACQPLALEKGVSVGGYVSDRYAWYDAGCQKRTAALVRNDARDPFGDNGGYLRAFSYVADGATRSVPAQPFTQWAGWGYVVNHYGSGSSAAISANVTGTWRTVFAGQYHAVHEFKMSLSPGGRIDVTVWWVFASGRSNPIFAITHDASPSGPNTVRADARGPYGNLAFDGVDGNVGGVEWGTARRFTMTSGSPFTMNATWDWTQPNLVPFANMWAASADAEMGEVQTQTWEDHVAGSDYGPGQTAACVGKTSASPGSCALWGSGGTMVANYLWPFQMNNWELQFNGSPTTSKRMAWGVSLGSVGQTSYSAWGRTLSGYPYQSYAVYLVLGKRSTGTTRAQVAEMEAVSRASLSATAGQVVGLGPGGAGRTDLVAYNPPGWDQVLGAWTLQADANRAAATLTLAAGDALTNPLVRVLGWTGGAPPTSVRLDGVALAAGTDYLASLDTATGAVWITLLRTVSGSASLSVQ
jgi:hypothetical protein